MKLIGIKGKSGSGKTTFARMLKNEDKEDKIGLINLDHISNMKYIKKKLPKSLVKKETHINSLGEEYTAFSSGVVKIINRIEKNKFLSEIYYSITDLVKNLGLRKEIKRNIKEGKNVIIIERSNIRRVKST